MHHQRHYMTSLTCRTKSTTSSIMGSSTSIASRDPVPAQLMPIARQDPNRMCALNDSARRETRRGTCPMRGGDRNTTKAGEQLPS